MKKTIVIMLFVVFLPVVLLLTSVQVTVNSDRFFSQQYTSNQVPTKTQMEMTELLRVTNEIQDYLLGQRQDFYIEGTVNGEVRQIFTEREVKHMVDVQVLFKRGIMLRNISVLLLTILCLWLWPKDKKLLFSALLV
ncbi:MAG: DUF1461 domain-containing protein, partial [Firmicutes bacterium]|nr:DUF1461 domain-containing protein [Bacillota bacterium]